nr:hypothetical protein [Allomuricauda sp.]
MRMLSLAFLGALVLLGSCKNEPKPEAQPEPVPEPKLGREISFYTPDSIQIIGDLYEQDKQGKTILLFHQGGSNTRGEYAPIIPRLLEEGYNILAIDQRVGGQYYGSYNRTLANIPTHGFGDGYGYCDAYNNLESALDYVLNSGFTGDKIIWGSSYSASLGIQLANNRQQDISGVLAFSPASGNSMKDCLPNGYFETIEIPLLILRPPHEMERETSKLQSEMAKVHGHKTFVPEHGVHGSSMLVTERVGADVYKTWEVVLSFLSNI